MKLASRGRLIMSDFGKSAGLMDKMKRPPFQKKKIAILFGYSGSGYSGLQINPGAKTIEQEVFSALCRAGVIWEMNSSDPKKVDWQRSCRTDKGVHAAGNVISCKGLLITNDVAKEDEWNSSFCVEKVNKELPKEISVFDIVRVTNSFDSHTQCDSRLYEYVFPTGILQASSLEFIASCSVKDGHSSASEEDLSGYLPDDDEIERIRSFRLPSDSLGRLKKLLGLYEGTKHFHNFTIGKSPSDPSSQRFIRSFTADSPFVAADGTEWIRVRVHGASFMLHQIRKMVSLAILSIRFGLSESIFQHALSTQTVRLNIPKAPGIGLYLDRACFDGYNKYLVSSQAAGVPSRQIDFLKYEEEREKLKERLIYPAIFGSGLNEFSKWLAGLEEHGYEFKYLLEHISE